MAERLAQIQGHLSNSFPGGLLAGKTAIVTGAGQGIGAETAILFAREGAKVIVADIDSQKSQQTAEKITASGGQALSVPGDVLNPDYINQLVTRAAEFGSGKIHIVVNNAGFTWDGVIHKTTDKQWQRIQDVHTRAPFQLVRAAAPYFRVKDGEDRTIVNISSTSGLHGNAGQANYSTAKMGVVGLTKAIAKEWGPQFGVRANTVAFGTVLTRLVAAKEDGAYAEVDGEKIALGIPKAQQKSAEGYVHVPLRRAGTPTEAAMSILAIASPLCSYVSGHTLEVTGGYGI
ncbi:short-chain dehydrogenase [Choiromyces venosus 120613-1]|uniref:Short-chain dehydrogenase n=1 Tax=Choiromyces venosus 120613-1 TaxID=1336337 RepID=A0A3N4J8L4_9PEZI|nr:short-chain dehydrogenase [Choiromyces venosus 120613-1]